MSKKAVRAVTFDLWDTIFIDDSDEPKRQAQNLPPKPVERRNLVESFLNKHQPISRELIEVAYDTTDAAFRNVWYSQNVTWTVEERLSVLLKGLGRELPKNEMDELIRLHEEMELAVKPDIAEDIGPALEGLAAKYKLGVISDTIFSPGRVLKQLLDHYGLLKYFSYFVFSDEIGCAKPNPIVFQDVAKGLGVDLDEIAHIGDREEKDIAGPHAVGGRGVYTTVILNRGEAKSADAICTDYKNLIEIIDGLNQ